MLISWAMEHVIFFPDDPEFMRKLRPKSVSANCIRLAKPVEVPEGWNPRALETLAKQWTTIQTPDDVTLRLRLSDGHAQINAPYMMATHKDLSDDKGPTATAYWGSVHEEGNRHV